MKQYMPDKRWILAPCTAISVLLGTAVN